MHDRHTITPCLWFASQAEAAAQFYTAVFKNSKIVGVTRYGASEDPDRNSLAGTVMTVAFELDGHPFLALNGGPVFTFTEAVSFQVYCDTQEEVDYYWERLGAGGDAAAQQCGWLKDQYGVSWQVIPRVLLAMLNTPDPAKAQRVTETMLPMKKLDIAALERAYAG